MGQDTLKLVWCESNEERCRAKMLAECCSQNVALAS